VATGFVALVPVALVGVVLLLDVLVDVLEVVDELEEVGLLDVLVLVLVLAVELVQSRRASWLTVPAPWSRFFTSVVVTDGGRFPTALVRAAAALPTSPHWCDASADEMEFS
jgi:hypothetical protein